MKILLLIQLLIIGNIGHTYGQISENNNTNSKKGIIICNKKFYKNFAILMQDTTFNGNRFDNWFGLSIEDNHTVNPQKTVQFPAFIIDSSLLIKSEKRMRRSDSSVTFYDYSNGGSGRILKHLKKYIRLYIGYVDMAKQLNVVVQFITPKAYKKNKRIYNYQLFLLANQKNLRFATIKFKPNEY